MNKTPTFTRVSCGLEDFATLHDGLDEFTPVFRFGHTIGHNGDEERSIHTLCIRRSLNMIKLDIMGSIEAPCLACLVFLFATFEWRSYQRRHLALERGCKPTKKYTQLNAPLGLGLLVRGIQDTRHLSFLEAWQQ